LAIALAAVVWLLEKNLEQAQEISKLNAEVADKSVQQGSDLKRQCAADADRYFKKWNNAQTPSTAQLGYESHYNSSQEVCFILIQSNDPSRQYLGLQLFDAVEQRQYAGFSSGEALLYCRLNPSDGEQKPCNSKAAFSAFVAGYMEAAPDLP
jgi:membrane-associated HD superfamily phosphohydrolase